MTEPTVDPSPGGTHTVTPHIVVRGAARAAEWYAGALGAEEQSRVPVPGGQAYERRAALRRLYCDVG
jgi:PhnB protein